MTTATQFRQPPALLRTDPLALIRASVTMLPAGIFVLLLMIGSTVSADSDLAPAAVDDGWRRTIDGWEQRASWNLSASMLRTKSQGEKTATVLKPEWDRYAVHPAALATGLVLLAWGGLKLGAREKE